MRRRCCSSFPSRSVRRASGSAAACSLRPWAAGLAVGVNLAEDAPLTAVGYATRSPRCSSSACSSGRSSIGAGELEGELAPHRNLSLDLIATTDFDGCFTSVNGAWTATLGYAARGAARAPADRLRPPRRSRGDARRAREARRARRGHAQLPEPLPAPRRLVPLARVDDPARREHGVVLRDRPRRHDAQGGRGLAAPAARAARDHPARDRRALAPRRDPRHDRAMPRRRCSAARSSGCA